jgi:hypothetical protein
MLRIASLTIFVAVAYVSGSVLGSPVKRSYLEYELAKFFRNPNVPPCKSWPEPPSYHDPALPLDQRGKYLNKLETQIAAEAVDILGQEFVHVSSEAGYLIIWIQRVEDFSIKRQKEHWDFSLEQLTKIILQQSEVRGLEYRPLLRRTAHLRADSLYTS